MKQWSFIVSGGKIGRQASEAMQKADGFGYVLGKNDKPEQKDGWEKSVVCIWGNTRRADYKFKFDDRYEGLIGVLGSSILACLADRKALNYIELGQFDTLQEAKKAVVEQFKLSKGERE